MKQLRLFPTALLATVMMLAMACSSTPKCTIHGTVTSQQDSLWLLPMEGNPTDSCAVQDGAFTFTTDRKPNTVIIITSKDQSARAIVIPDAKDIQVTIGDGPAVVTGSPLSEELMTLQQWIMQLFNDANEKAMELYSDGKREEGAAVMEEMHKT